MIKNLRKSSITYTPFKTFKEWKFDSVNSSSAIPFSPREGIKIDGIFYPSESIYYNSETEPTNSDGTYKRVIYNAIDLAFEPEQRNSRVREKVRKVILDEINELYRTIIVKSGIPIK
jgi:hypothetical protein